MSQGKVIRMKKIFGIILAVVFVAGVAMPGYAAKASSKKASAKKYERIVANVVTLDVAARTIGVTEEKTGASRTITISAKAAEQLNVGDRVRIKLKAGTDESAGVRVLRPMPTEEEAADAAAISTVTPAVAPEVEKKPAEKK